MIFLCDIKITPTPLLFFLKSLLNYLYSKYILTTNRFFSNMARLFLFIGIRNISLPRTYSLATWLGNSPLLLSLLCK